MFGSFSLRPSHQHGTIHPPVNGLVDAFLLSRRAAGCTTATLGWYEPRLRRFAAFVGDVPAAKITPELVRRFLLVVKAGLEGSPTSDAYVGSFQRGLAALFTWAVAEEWLARSPMRNVPRVRADEKAIDVLTEEEVRRLIAAQPARTIAGLRNATMIAFLYDTGVRVGELVKIRLTDLEIERGVAKVIGKGRREREVPIGLKLRRALLAYLHRGRAPRLFDTGDGRLFVGRDDRPLRTNAVNQMLVRAGRRAGITRAVYPHLLRHSFATQYLRNGGDEITLQTILGHRTATMTRRYVHLAARDVAQRHAAASPLDRLGG